MRLRGLFLIVCFIVSLSFISTVCQPLFFASLIVRNNRHVEGLFTNNFRNQFASFQLQKSRKENKHVSVHRPEGPYREKLCPWSAALKTSQHCLPALMKMTDYYIFCDFNCNSGNECKIKQYADLMKKKYISFTGTKPFNIRKNLIFIIHSKL